MVVIKDIIERRVNATGVSEPVVTTQGTDRVVVELPGVTDPDAIRKLVGQTGRLDFVPLGSTQVDPGPGARPQAVPAAVRRRPGLVAQRSAPTRTAARRSTSCSRATAPSCSATTPPATSASYFAIVLDGAVVSAPVIQNAIPNGNVQITGGGLGGLQRQGRDQPRHDPQVRLAAVPDHRAVEPDRSARPWAASSSTQTVLAGAHRDRARARVHAHLLPAAGRRRELRAHLLHARRWSRSSGSSRSRSRWPASRASCSRWAWRSTPTS